MSRRLWAMGVIALVGTSVAACTKANPASTCSNGVCTDPSYRFCDVDGLVGGIPNACVAVHCDPGTFEACDGSNALVCDADGNSYDTTLCGTGCNPASGCNGSCTPGAPISCEANMATNCAGDGNSFEHEGCALGCSTTEPRCLTFTPSNGQKAALVDSQMQADVTFPAGTRIDTDSGLVQDAGGTPIHIKTLTQSQVGGRPIRVFEVHSLVAADVTIVGSNPVAFVSWGEMSLNGLVAARGHGSVAGPGAQSAAACSGGDAQQYQAGGCGIGATGAGGAGNRNPGGQGGAPLSPNGGAALTAFSPLVGGCSGGNQLDTSGGNVAAHGGGGGGAIQLVSQTAVTLANSGLIDVGAGGGQATAGGGSGGVVIIEAPKVTITGGSAGIVANGGAGGGCGMAGSDGTATTASAAGATCTSNFSGSGGTGATVPGTGCRQGVDTCTGTCPPAYGGGGGSVGRLRIVTADGNYATSGTPVMSIGIVTEVITPE